MSVKDNFPVPIYEVLRAAFSWPNVSLTREISPGTFDFGFCKGLRDCFLKTHLDTDATDYTEIHG
jgi:hypothetical protein